MFVPLTPLRCLHRAMDLFGGKTGVVSGSRHFTYAQFGERCERLASALPKIGVARGDRIAFLSFNNHQLMEGYYGVVQARGIVMPLNVRLSEPELTNILCHSGAKILMFENDFAPIVEKLRANCRSIEKWISLDDAIPCADLCYEALLDQGRPERADIFSYDEMAVAELFYTSGSTGTPKGVALSHRTLYLHALSVGYCYHQPESMVELHTIPLFHANGWGRPQVSTMLGCKQVMIRRFDPNIVFRLIQEHGVTDMCLVPTMANSLLNALSTGTEQWDSSSLRYIMTGGAASSAELVERMENAFHCDVYAGYGLTETAPLLSTSCSKPGLAYASDADRQRRRSMAGWPVIGMQVRVVDPDMNDVPRDMQTIGEIVTSGDHVMEGYYREPEATAAVMSGPWFHTGDMAVWDEETFLQIVDRKKEIIISGGENISSIEVEKAIFAHPDVFECAVVGAPDETWGEIPAAIVVRKPGSALTSEELIEFLKARLGKFKLPRIIAFSEEPLPKTGTGKIRKLVLREQFWQGKEKRVQG